MSYSSEITEFLTKLLGDLRFKSNILPDAYSHFVGNYSRNTSSSDDAIEYDVKTINGMIHLEQLHLASMNMLSKQIFFLFVKTLHELAHAAIFKSGRTMSSTHCNIHTKHELYTTPATHALSGEAGNAIERYSCHQETLMFSRVLYCIV